jgi:hypothetical protein
MCVECPAPIDGVQMVQETWECGMLRVDGFRVSLVAHPQSVPPLLFLLFPLVAMADRDNRGGGEKITSSVRHAQHADTATAADEWQRPDKQTRGRLQT